MDWFSKILLGHFVGDYLLQNEWMALNKSRESSWAPGLVHACLYTLSICMFTWDWRLSWILVVFISHWPVDKWSLAEVWLKLINGRTLTGFMKNGHEDLHALPKFNFENTQQELEYYKELPHQKENYRILRGSFHALVYAVTDNTIHILLMVGGWYLLKHLGL
jgi:hypothetical protein